LETRTNYKGNIFNKAQATNQIFATYLDYLDFIKAKQEVLVCILESKIIVKLYYRDKIRRVQLIV
jgi:hypothetical protein